MNLISIIKIEVEKCIETVNIKNLLKIKKIFNIKTYRNDYLFEDNMNINFNKKIIYMFANS